MPQEKRKTKPFAPVELDGLTSSCLIGNSVPKREYMPQALHRVSGIKSLRVRVIQNKM